MSDEVQVDGRLVDSTRCVYLQSNVMGSGLIYRCAANGTVKVLVPAKTAGGMFFGTGVSALVCREHANELLEKYGGRLPT